MSDQLSIDDRVEDVRLRTAWEEVMRAISHDLPPSVTKKFLRPLSPQNFTDGTLELVAPGDFVAEWVRGKYLSRIQEALCDELGELVTVKLVVGTRQRPPVETPSFAMVQSATISDSRPSNFVPDPRFTFDAFVVGQSNRLAFAGAKAVASEPGKKYNPLFIYGSVGLGKTHLMNAIAHEILGNDPSANIVYIPAQTFAEQFVHALQTNRIEAFRRSQRGVGVWLVDDIQMIVGKDKTQEEVFHTFNILYQTGKQIVFCGDRPPSEMYAIEDRLRSRFQSGLVVDIRLPDTETRAAILMSKAQATGFDLSLGIALFLAERVPGNIRVLEEALTKYSVMVSLDGRRNPMEVAEQMVAEYYHVHQRPKPNVDRIVNLVSKHYAIPREDILGTSRKAPIVLARHVAVFLTRELTGDSWTHIASQFGGKDHTSMLHAFEKISTQVATNHSMADAVEQLRREIDPKG